MVLSVSGKVLTQLLLMWICNQLLKLNRPKQSGFMPKVNNWQYLSALPTGGASTRVLAGYAGSLCRSQESVHHKALWGLLQLHGILARTIGVLTGLYK